MDVASQAITPMMAEYLPSGSLWLLRVLLGTPGLLMGLLMLQLWRQAREESSLPLWAGAGLAQFLMMLALAMLGLTTPTSTIAIVACGNIATALLVVAGLRRLVHADADVRMPLAATVLLPLAALGLLALGSARGALLLNFATGVAACLYAAWHGRRLGPVGTPLVATLLLRAAIFAAGPVVTQIAPHYQTGLLATGILVFATVLIAALNCVLRRRHSAQQASREALWNTEELLAAASDITEMAAQGLAREQLARNVVARLHAAITPLSVLLYDFDPSRREFLLQMLSADPNGLSGTVERVAVHGNAHLARVANGELVLIHDLANDPGAQPRTREFARSQGIGQQLIIPISTSDEVIGALTLLFGHREPLPASWIQAAAVVARVVGLALRVHRQLEELRIQARHDTLTGLLNRSGLHEEFERRRREDSMRNPALLLIGLARFKEVNDAFGHRTGDQLIRTSAQRLGALAAQTGAACARLGGDEFALLAPGLGEQAADALGQRIQSLLREPFDIDTLRVSVGAGIGIALDEQDRLDSHAMLRRADVAMRHAKIADLQCSLYAPALDPDARERLELASDVLLALDEGQFSLFYQPKIRLHDGGVAGVEALIRWEHPERGWIPPARFIPMMELGTLIDRISLWVARTALIQAMAWRERGLEMPIAINVSPRNLLSPAWCDEFLTALRIASLPRGALEIEITETSLMSSAEQASARLGELAAAGVTVAIDDFGTGYSSLSYLQALSIDTIKIDRSFMKDIVATPRNEKIAATVIALGKSLGLAVVAEGIEDAATDERLRALGCDLGQGYLYSRPLPAAEFEAWLAARTGAG